MSDYRTPDIEVEPRGGAYVLTGLTRQGLLWLKIQATARGWVWQDGSAIVRGLTSGLGLVTAILDAGLMVGDAKRPTVRASRTAGGEWVN